MMETNDVADGDVNQFKNNYKGLIKALSELIRERLTFEKELTTLINKYSKENDSNTPDFLLAEYLIGCIDVYNKTLQKRAKWNK